MLKGTVFETIFYLLSMYNGSSFGFHKLMFIMSFNVASGAALWVCGFRSFSSIDVIKIVRQIKEAHSNESKDIHVPCLIGEKP
jgi:hypothetical protein